MVKDKTKMYFKNKNFLKKRHNYSVMRAFIYAVARYHKLKSPNQGFSVKRILFLPGV